LRVERRQLGRGQVEHLQPPVDPLHRLHRPGHLDVQPGVGRAVQRGDGSAELRDIHELGAIDAVQSRTRQKQNDKTDEDDRGDAHEFAPAHVL